MTEQTGFLVGFLLYLLAMIALGWWASHREKGAKGSKTADHGGHGLVDGGCGLCLSAWLGGHFIWGWRGARYFVIGLVVCADARIAFYDDE